jgi:hypothetical protein
MSIVRYFIIGALALSSIMALAQSTTKATTADGKQVLLSSDGTWKYVEVVSTAGKASQEKFSKPQKATAVLTLNKGKCSLWYDPILWSTQKSDDPNRYNFVHKSGDVYFNVIAERLDMTLDGLRDLALNNARSASSALTIVKEERRIVNGSEVLFMYFEPTIQGVNFAFQGYYFVGQANTIQIIAYTSKGLLTEYLSDIQDLLNGFEVMPIK